MDYERLKRRVQQRLDRQMHENGSSVSVRNGLVSESDGSVPVQDRRTSGKTALCITVPKTVSWSDYERELDDVADGMMEMNYRLPSYPKRVTAGDRCYVVHDGMIRGWMTITGIEERTKPFQCQTTGTVWDAGVYIRRSGPFHYLSRPVPMKGFMGYKYITEID